MDIHLPDDLTRRLEQYAIGTGQDITAVVREAIETRLSLPNSRPRISTAGGCRPEAEIQQGLDDLASGRYTEHDDRTLADLFEDIKARGRARLDTLKLRGH